MYRQILSLLLCIVMILSFSVVSFAEDDRIPEAGDHIFFGHYEQDGNNANGMEKIWWRVLSVEKGKVLAISEYCLDAKAFNDKASDVKWETCTLRKWLNNEFFEMAFTDEEGSIIQLTCLENNPEAGTNRWDDTEDRVFLLSIAEAEKYFANDESRKAYATQFAKNNGAYVNSDNSASRWLLRSLSSYPEFPATIYFNGSICTLKYIGDDVYDTEWVVRPALWISLEF